LKLKTKGGWDYLPSWFFWRKRKEGGHTSDSDVCEVPIAIGRVVYSVRLDLILLIDQAKSSIERQQIKNNVSLLRSSSPIRKLHFYCGVAPPELVTFSE